nr:SufE Fe/S-cluster-related protein [uncultured Mediterranean phage uvMED]|tara:strand:+ start:4657 stop:5331 length:675 start_codon:yes stop_codon:yes gene_type:complete
MYIKGGMKKLSKAIAKSTKESLDREIAIAEKEQQMMDEANGIKFPTNPSVGDTVEAPEPVLNEDRKGVDLADGSKLEDMSIKEKLGTWSHNFSQLEEKEKFYYLLEQGKGIIELDESKRINGYRIHGCVSQVWMIPSLKEDKMLFEVDADSHEARGVMYILQNIMSGHTPKEILEVTDDDIVDIGFYGVLTERRRKGVFVVMQAIRTYAKDMEEILDEAAKAQG